MALARTGGPTAILLTRQKVPALAREATGELADMRRGAYVLAGRGEPEVILAATGSEVHLALAARDVLAAEGRSVRVVSVPCLDLFLEQDEDYRGALFPAGARVATLEAGITAPWRVLAGPDGLTLGLDRFGASAPAGELAKQFGFTADSVLERVREWLG